MCRPYNVKTQNPRHSQSHDSAFCDFCVDRRLNARWLRAPFAPASAASGAARRRPCAAASSAGHDGASRAPSETGAFRSGVFVAGSAPGGIATLSARNESHRPSRNEAKRSPSDFRKATVAALSRGLASSAPTLCISSGKLTVARSSTLPLLSWTRNENRRYQRDVHERLSDGAGVRRGAEIVLAFGNILGDGDRVAADRPKRRRKFLAAVVRHILIPLWGPPSGGPIRLKPDPTTESATIFSCSNRCKVGARVWHLFLIGGGRCRFRLGPRPRISRPRQPKAVSVSMTGLAIPGRCSSRTRRTSLPCARPSSATWPRFKPDFAKRNVKVIGLSVDPLDKHKGWSKDIKKPRGTRRTTR